MIQAIGAIGAYSDPEYLMISRKLRALGLSPSGNKEVDRGRLKKAEEKQENQESFPSSENVQTLIDNEDILRAELEERRLGATTLAELNRYFLLHA